MDEEAEPIEADQDGASLVADDSDREWEVDAKCGDQQAGDDCGGEYEILPEDAPSMSCDPKDERDVFKLVTHENDIRRLHGDIGACGSHGNANIR